ncbi:MAG: hypothetical protein JO040_01795 [Gemmatimonadetes bacterium]|nr:hypothetical protein [Gemmatimonadota bacterium]
MPNPHDVESPVTRWHPDNRAEKNRRKHQAGKAKGQGVGVADAPAQAASPAPYTPDELDLERVRCACGRWTFALCMVDVQGVPAAIRGDAEEVCDGCWTAWVREGKLSRAELAAYQGAPQEVVEHIRSHGNPHLP